MIHHGDCLDVMASMDPESVDAIVTDPPYGLEFMGKEWDRLGDRGQIKHDGPQDRDASTVFGRQRVSFYGSANRKCRACGHWEWSGTPCACEKPDFETRQAPQARLMQEWHARWAEAAYRVAKPSAYLLAFGGTRTVHRMTVALEDAGWIIRDMLVWGYASGFPKSKASLKPAWEPIVMARKPGPLRMLAIDECRIPSAADDLAGWHSGYDGPKFGGTVYAESDMTGTGAKDPAGRWPANIVLTDPIFDGGIEGVVGGGETGLSSGRNNGNKGSRIYGAGSGLQFGGEGEEVGYGDTGTYSRFFLVPKAARSDREPVLGGSLPRADLRTMSDGANGHDPLRPIQRENVHPTVKPTDLMRHLVRLVTPAGGVVLDPFLGSGTTGLAAEMEGFAWIGIEREAEYVAIAEARLNGTQKGLGI